MELNRRRALQVAGLGVAGLTLGAVPSAGARARASAPQPQPGSGAGPAPAGPQVAGFYRFKIGALEAIALSDGTLALDKIQPTLAPEAPAAELKQTLSDALAPTDSATLEINVLCVRIGAETILIDAGWGQGGPAGGKLLANLSAAGIRPESITGVVITHAHPDHLAGVTDGSGKLTFPSARIFVNRAEHAFWTGPNPDLSGMRMPDEVKKGWVASSNKTFEAVKGKLELVKPGDRILGGVELLDGAGHTAGHMPVIISDGAEQLAVIGDIAHHPVLMFARPEWATSLDADPKQAVASRRRLFDRFAGERSRVFAYHLPWPGLGRIGKHGESFWWAGEQWKW